MTVREQPNNLLEREIRIVARPETVFAFFVDPARMVEWMGRDVVLDARPGGAYRIDMNGLDIASGRFLELVPHSRLVFSWGWENDGSTPRPGASTVEITLAPDGDGTLLRLRHLGLSADERGSHGEGWDYFLPRLAQAAATAGG